MRFKIAILSLLIFFSCTKQIKIDFPKEENKLVVNSLFTNNEQIIIKLTKTLNYNTVENTDVKNATCRLFVNDIYVETLTEFDQGIYKSTTLTETGNIYKIEISAEDFETVTAESYIPEQNAILSFDTVHSSLYDPQGLGVYYTKGILNIKDNPGTEDYFQTKIRLIDSTGKEYNPIFKYRSNEPILINEGILNYEPRFLLFNDQTFNGEYRSLVFEYDFSIGFLDTLLLIVDTKQITKDYYEYAKTSVIQTYQQQDNTNPFAIGEPTQIYTNINNGVGIFSGYSTFSDTTILYGWSIKK